MKPRIGRIVGGVILAILLSASIAKANEGILEAICAAVGKDSVEWYLFGCYLL